MLCLVMTQKGTGCDYTIGCGTRVVGLKATTLEAAREEAKKVFADFGCSGDRDLAAADIVEVKEDAMPLLHEFQEGERRVQNEADMAAKRAQLEKLKRELGET